MPPPAVRKSRTRKKPSPPVVLTRPKRITRSPSPAIACSTIQARALVADIMTTLDYPAELWLSGFEDPNMNITAGYTSCTIDETVAPVETSPWYQILRLLAFMSLMPLNDMPLDLLALHSSAQLLLSAVPTRSVVHNQSDLMKARAAMIATITVKKLLLAGFNEGDDIWPYITVKECIKIRGCSHTFGAPFYNTLCRMNFCPTIDIEQVDFAGSLLTDWIQSLLWVQRIRDFSGRRCFEHIILQTPCDTALVGKCHTAWQAASPRYTQGSNLQVVTIPCVPVALHLNLERRSWLKGKMTEDNVQSMLNAYPKAHVTPSTPASTDPDHPPCKCTFPWGNAGYKTWDTIKPPTEWFMVGNDPDKSLRFEGERFLEEEQCERALTELLKAFEKEYMEDQEI